VIVTVTLNPALHVRYLVERVAPGTANRISRVSYTAGERGLAVARVLHTFGHEVVAAGLAGGATGALIRAELAKAGVPSEFTPITAESRRVVQVADIAAGLVTSFAEPAPYITTEELGRLAGDYRGLLDGADAVVLCGSLPEGLPPETYASLASYAAAAGVPVVLDAGGDALRLALSRGPALVIPDLGTTPADAADGVADLATSHGISVAIPTARGVRVLTTAGEWRAELGISPLEAPDPAEYRDALVAGFVPGIALGWSWPEMLRHALALAASTRPGGEADLVSYETLLGDVVIAERPLAAIFPE
jgi:tagatose 6-phosphate kinase